MLYARFETKKNIIFIYSFTDMNLQDVFFGDLYTKVLSFCLKYRNRVDKTLKFIEMGETNKATCVNYSPTFNRFYTIIRKVNI